MATTTQILFNSPALHSLKRDQLVKLCKIHSIKANGKNTELIERLKAHAQALPPEAPGQEEDAMDVEEDARGDGNDLPGGFPEMETDEYAMDDVVLTSRFAIPRPSEQWEVVMDDIEELDESGMGTMSSKGSLRTVSNGEFGTHSSKASVTSSLKALATSLGIKRTGEKSSHGQEDDGSTNSKGSKGKELASFSPGKLFAGKAARDSLVEHATPYSQLPPSESLPESDHFKFSTPDSSFFGPGDGDEGEDALVPGGSSRPVRPAPLGARLSMGIGQSTIRLVTHPAAPRTENTYMSPPRLPAIQPDFDIKMGTPSAGRILSVWPASPMTATGSEDRLYPQLPFEDVKAAKERAAREASAGDGDEDDAPMPGGMFASASTPARTRTATGTSNATATPRPTNTPGPVDEPDMFSPSKPTAASSATAQPSGGERPAIPRSAPFLFGSPLPRRETPKAGANTNGATDSGAGVSNVAFEGAAKSVLEEMHRRLAEAQKEREKNGESKPVSSAANTAATSIFGGLTFGGAGAGASGEAGAADRFAKTHEAQFAKMDSITNHYAARRPAANARKRKSDVLGPGTRPGQKRRSSAAGTRVISNGARKNRAVPGGFGGEEEEESGSEAEGGGEEGGAKEAEGGGRAVADEVEDLGARRSSKRMRIAEGWDVHRGQRVSLAPPLSPAEEEKKQRERDAIKRELDAAKARRRSSRGRVSMGGKAAPVPAKGKASRFGFLSSAKSIVKNVWNLGGGKAKAAASNPPPSAIPVPKAAPAPVIATGGKIDDMQKIGKGAAPKAVTANTSTAQHARKPSGTHSRIPSVSSTSGKLLKPSAGPVTTDAKATGTISSTKSGASSTSRARSPIPSFAQPTASSKNTASAASGGTARSRVSSTAGTATSTSRQSTRTSTVSSMGTRSSLASGSTSTAVSSVGTRRSMASTSTLASTNSKSDASAKAVTDGTARKRTSSLLAPTASSLAKVNAAVKPSASGRSSGLPPVVEAQKRPTGIPGPSRSPLNARMSSTSPPGRIFSQPLTNFGSPSSAASPVHHPSLGAAATTLFNNADDSSPSKIPRPAVIPPKPKSLVARKPRISRSRVIAKVGAQRVAAARSSAGSPNARTRSSFGARRSFGGVKSGRASAGAEIMRGAAKKRARQSEYSRRRSRAGAGENEGIVD